MYRRGPYCLTVNNPFNQDVFETSQISTEEHELQSASISLGFYGDRQSLRSMYRNRDGGCVQLVEGSAGEERVTNSRSADFSGVNFPKRFAPVGAVAETNYSRINEATGNAAAAIAVGNHTNHRLNKLSKATMEYTTLMQNNEWNIEHLRGYEQELEECTKTFERLLQKMKQDVEQGKELVEELAGQDTPAHPVQESDGNSVNLPIFPGPDTFPRTPRIVKGDYAVSPAGAANNEGRSDDHPGHEGGVESLLGGAKGKSDWGMTNKALSGSVISQPSDSTDAVWSGSWSRGRSNSTDNDFDMLDINEGNNRDREPLGDDFIPLNYYENLSKQDLIRKLTEKDDLLFKLNQRLTEEIQWRRKAEKKLRNPQGRLQEEREKFAKDKAEVEKLKKELHDQTYKLALLPTYDKQLEDTKNRVEDLKSEIKDLKHELYLKSVDVKRYEVERNTANSLRLQAEYRLQEYMTGPAKPNSYTPNIALWGKPAALPTVESPVPSRPYVNGTSHYNGPSLIGENIDGELATHLSGGGTGHLGLSNSSQSELTSRISSNTNGGRNSCRNAGSWSCEYCKEVNSVGSSAFCSHCGSADRQRREIASN